MVHAYGAGTSNLLAATGRIQRAISPVQIRAQYLNLLRNKLQ